MVVIFFDLNTPQSPIIGIRIPTSTACPSAEMPLQLSWYLSTSGRSSSPHREISTMQLRSSCPALSLKHGSPTCHQRFQLQRLPFRRVRMAFPGETCTPPTNDRARRNPSTSNTSQGLLPSPQRPVDPSQFCRFRLKRTATFASESMRIVSLLRYGSI